MSNYGSAPDYDRYLDHLEEARGVENDAFLAFCEERGLDADSDHAVDEWEDFKMGEYENELSLDALLAERMEMELRDGE